MLSASVAHAQESRLLDGFEDISAWKATASDSVSASLRQVDGAKGKALCLDYDFNGVSGYAVARRNLPMRYPGNYEYRMSLRGEGPANNLEFKLADASGDNVWWRNQPNTVLPATWTATKLKKRQIDFAWGPIADRTLRATESFELTISAGKGGGNGSACIDELAFRELPPSDDSPIKGWMWRSRGDSWIYELDKIREIGGIIVRGAPMMYRVSLSDDAKHWRTVQEVTASGWPEHYIALPEEETRYVRIERTMDIGDGSKRDVEVEAQPLSFAATPNDFVKQVAKRQPRGEYPRGFVDEQQYWTIVGLDGGKEQGLIGEDGAIEVGKGAFSIEPMLVVPGEGSVTWAGVKAIQSLRDGYLPIPSVRWQRDDLVLDITAFAAGEPGKAQLVARYKLTNTSRKVAGFTFILRARPFQVNPPSQFLNTIGGVSPIHSIGFEDGRLTVNAARQVVFSPLPIEARMHHFNTHENEWSLIPLVNESTGLAHASMHYKLRLAPGESWEVAWTTSLEGGKPRSIAPDEAARMQEAVAAQWRDKLDRVRIKVPPQGQRVVDTLRTSLAHMLISRTGPRLQPGTRSYARAWIRDGAMINEGLLRMGREDVAEDFLRWYAPYQFPSGKVPCCVDDRGSDPVPENDSHGELIYAVAEQYRYTRDRALLEAMWPHVVGAVKYMDELRASERTEENRARNPAFYGMMPASISHEGYSAKPMHSYWDNFWALRGYKDAVEIAQWLGKAEDAKHFAASRDQFRADLYASIDIATKQKGIDFIPGAAELGDFDATSTTIALAPGGEQDTLPQALLHNTFERYWREFVQRRDGKREWKDYTPYELRTVGTFVRLGWRERAHEALDFFFKDRQPPAWNQWAEVVSRTPRTPFFLGDLPHAWVESDYVRSVLDMFAYSRETDDALVIAAGIPADWLDGEGIAIEGLRTPQGQLAYTLKTIDGVLRLDVPAGLAVPKGGLVLSLPEPWARGRASSNGRALPLSKGEARITALPARIEIHMPR